MAARNLALVVAAAKRSTVPFRVRARFLAALGMTLLQEIHSFRVRLARGELLADAVKDAVDELDRVSG